MAIKEETLIFEKTIHWRPPLSVGVTKWIAPAGLTNPTGQRQDKDGPSGGKYFSGFKKYIFLIVVYFFGGLARMWLA